jgi:hypothetical protein
MNIDTKIKCVKKEVQRRKKYFPYLIENGKLTQEEADLELFTMQEVLETLTQFKGVMRD